MKGQFSERQAAAVIAAVTRSVFEAEQAVNTGLGQIPREWGYVGEAEREALRYQACVVMDVLTRFDREGAGPAEIEKAIASYARQRDIPITRANLMISVAAAVLKTLVDELPEATGP